MKIGIITFHSVINYGSALQAYAMQEGIAKCGVETEIIDYRPGKISIADRVKNNWARLFSLAKWKRFLGSKINAKKIYYINDDRARRRTEKFFAFQEEIFRLSELIQNRSDLLKISNKYDAFACGSDQIWNPTYIGHDLSYFIDFVSNDNLKIAYAPSIAVSEFPAEYRDEIRNAISHFSRVSVRESESVDVVKKLTGRDATVVVDPTLLLDQADWERIEKAPSIEYTKEPYIFCYFLGPNPEYCGYVNKLKELTGLKIVLVTCTELKVFKNYGDIVCDDIGPSEFVYLIHHAEYVCTDSFHGTVFSIINQKNFFTFKRYNDVKKSNENSRIYTLLRMIDSEERLIECADSIKLIYNKQIDYDLVKSKITCCSEKSFKYLKEEIKRVMNYGGKANA